jgi:hypothetical protein
LLFFLSILQVVNQIIEIQLDCIFWVIGKIFLLYKFLQGMSMSARVEEEKKVLVDFVVIVHRSLKSDLLFIYTLLFVIVLFQFFPYAL